MLEFVPRKFEMGTPSQAMDYLSEKKAGGSDFEMNDVVRVQTGVAQIEESDVLRKIEEKAIEKLKEVRENTYAQAYQLGLDEGSKKAFEHKSKEINERLESLDRLLTSLVKIKSEVFHADETHLMTLLPDGIENCST